MISKYWPLGTKLRAKRDVNLKKSPISCTGISLQDGSQPPGDWKLRLKAGALYIVVRVETQPILLQRISQDTDAGKVHLVIEMEDAADWEPC